MVLEESAHVALRGRLVLPRTVLHRAPLAPCRWERQQWGVVFHAALRLGVAHNDAPKQRVKQRQRLLLFGGPRLADTVRPEPVRLVAEAERPHAQEGQLAVKVVHPGVQGSATHHPPEVGRKTATRYRQLRGRAAYHLALVEHHPAPPHARQNLPPWALQLRVRGQHHVSLGELAGPDLVLGVARPLQAALVDLQLERAGPHALRDLRLPLPQQGGRDHDERGA
mmetsp:Transcript_14667/g.35897  ORF Transcript_14667/g.35897 Transcript_14667/m.35897 type:complete len:224 (+) Transcript_14667:462-1133(+)